jgi:TRAP-type C4-dicarboxylate transport system permease small subunit
MGKANTLSAGMIFKRLNCYLRYRVFKMGEAGYLKPPSLFYPQHSTETMLRQFDRFLGFVSALTKYIMLVMTACIFIIIIFTVFSRYLFNYVASWSEEVPRYLLVWIGFLGAALAVNQKEHIGFDYIYNLFPYRARHVLGFLLNLGIAAIGWIMLVYGIDFVNQFGSDWMESIPFTNIWFYISLPISGALILLYVIRDEIRVISALFNRRK